MEWDTELYALKQCLDVVPEEDERAEIGPREFVRALLLSFLRHRGERSLESLRDGVQSVCGKRLARSSFWQRMAALRLRLFLEAVIAGLMKRLSQACSICPRLLEQLGVTGIVLVDSSSNSLPGSAESTFPAPRKNVVPASIKLHACLDLLSGALSWFELSPAKEHDRKHFPLIKSLKGKLVIFDLGYWDYGLLAAIDQIGGFFLSRLKANSRLRILSVVEGLPKRLYKGEVLLDQCLRFGKNHASRIIEVMGEFLDGGQRVLEARVIGFWNPMEKKYHWYVTNLRVPAVLIYPLYRLRWQLELFFKSLKGTFRLADQPSACENIIRSLVLIAVIAAFLAFPLSQALAMEFIEERKLCSAGRGIPTPSLQRGARLLLYVSGELAEYLRSATDATFRALLEKLRRFAPDLIDPNYARRESSLARVLRMAEELR